MAVTKIVLAPGIDREGTAYSAEGKYFDGDKVRFRSGKPEKTVVCLTTSPLSEKP